MTKNIYNFRGPDGFENCVYNYFFIKVGPNMYLNKDMI